MEMTYEDETVEQFNSSTETLRRLYCANGGTISEFDGWLAQVPRRLIDERSNGANPWVPAFLSRPAPPKGLSLAPEVP